MEDEISKDFLQDTSDNRSEVQKLLEKAKEVELKNKQRLENRRIERQQDHFLKTQLEKQELKKKEANAVLSMLGKALGTYNSSLLRDKNMVEISPDNNINTSNYAERKSLADISLIKSEVSELKNNQDNKIQENAHDNIQGNKLLSKRQLDEIKQMSENELENFNKSVASKFGDDDTGEDIQKMDNTMNSRSNQMERSKIEQMEEDLAEEIGSVVEENRSNKSMSLASADEINETIGGRTTPAMVEQLDNVLGSEVNTLMKKIKPGGNAIQ